MRIVRILLIFTVMAVIIGCGHKPRFKTDVSTKKKPWTNLAFNNHPENFQFAIVSDRNGGNRPGIFDDAVNKLNLMQPEFVLSVGDLIAGYTTDTAEISRQWKGVNDIISGLRMPYFYLPGNHDITNKVMQKEWEKHYGRRYYNFTYHNVLFLILDSNDDEEFNLSREQTDYALEVLKKNSSARWTFILMHHPIWTYNTNGRFQEIEKTVAGRKFTVIAGHEHHYRQFDKNGSNYYILSTTGAGSALRGNLFGEFDHISWVTMGENGPIMANLKLDGILPHDISNEKTDELAKPLIQNATFRNVLLCNQGDKFSNGTLYLSFRNPTSSKLKIGVSFFHHHQLQIRNSMIDETIDPGSSKVLEIPVSSAKPLDYSAIDLLLYSWQLKYDDPAYKDFGLTGKGQAEVRPTQTRFIGKEADKFAGNAAIPFVHPFESLEAVYSLNHSAEQKYHAPVEISETANLSFRLKNSRNEFSAPENRAFDKVSLSEGSPVSEARNGLKYGYFEGEWTEMPDFTKLQPISSGVAANFQVVNYAKRQDNWGQLFEGYFQAKDDGICQFRIRATGTCRLFVDSQMVAGDARAPRGDYSGTAGLKKGYHKIRVEFMKRKGDARLRLTCKMEGAEEWQPVESSLYFN